ncbi:MAG: hypothetical protein GF390_01850 [Candidatus Pacebacteria bacterium]|nr:hypothetical protein [Candidatus Paceibacterota bacterium]
MFKKKKQLSIKINLAPKDPFFETVVGKSLKWALSVGRYVVIFTELVVILSFLARFSLDRQVTDLNETIHQKEMIIRSYGDLEQNLILAQKKIEQYQQVAQYTNIADVFPSLKEITPSGVLLETLAIKPGSVVLEGNVRTQADLNLLVNNIQLSPDFFEIVIDTIETEDDKKPGFHFRLSALTKQIGQISESETSKKAQ